MTNKPKFIEDLENQIDSWIQNGEEPYVLSQIQETINSYDIPECDLFLPFKKDKISFNANEAIDDMERCRMVAEMLLIRSWNTYQVDKYQYILGSTVKLIKLYRFLRKYEELVKECEHVEMYIEDAIDKSPNNFNIISTICDIFYNELNARLEISSDIKPIMQKLDSYIPFFIIAADKDKYRLNAAFVIGQIADTLAYHKKFAEACIYYPYAIQLLSEIDSLNRIDKRELAVFIGHYSVALTQKTPQDLNIIKENVAYELSIYEQLYRDFSDIRSTMDLAIANSHYAMYYQLLNDHKETANYHLKKIKLINETFLLDENDADASYTNEMRLESIYNSMQPIINCGLLSENPKDQIAIFKSAHTILSDTLHYVDDIQIVQYLNAFAMQIFRIAKDYDIENAENFLFKKFIVLINLILKFGPEEGIISDLKQTYFEALPFISKIRDNLKESNIKIWNEITEIV